MRVTYDPEVDVLKIVFSERPIEESDEDKPGMVLDYDAAGGACPERSRWVVSLEILDASKKREDPRAFQFAVAS